MHTSKIFLLKALKKLYKSIFYKSKNPYKLISEYDGSKSSELIYNALISDKPCMIARFGATELHCLYNYLGVKSKERNYIKFIQGKIPPFWWNESIIQQMQNWSGFFPPTHEKIEAYCELLLKDILELDILGSWMKLEYEFTTLMNVEEVHLWHLEPFWSKYPWSSALEGKNILVIHPFKYSILNQYSRRKLLFENHNVLPEFKSLKVIEAVQTLGKSDTRFNDWFDALDFMKKQIDESDFDICLIGAGAYGFSLAAHVKRKGKKAVHLGGALQLLFGIRGKRWENQSYNVKEWGLPEGSYTRLINNNWVRPNQETKPKIKKLEGDGHYW